MRQPRVVAMYLGRGPFGDAIIMGVAKYVRPSHPWLLSVMPRLWRKARVGGTTPDGLIVQIRRPRLLDRMNKTGTPFVNVSGQTPNLPPNTVTLDNRAVGVMAADHLLSLGIKHFGFVGNRDQYVSVPRLAGFEQRVSEAGGSVDMRVFLHTIEKSVLGELVASDPRRHLLAAKIRSLPKPAGIFCNADAEAVAVTYVCRALGLSVPADVAVLGCTNDAPVCEMGWPSVSSIEFGAQRVGYEAARLLAQLMDGGPGRNAPLLLKPVGVVHRESTRVQLAKERCVDDAIAFMGNHFSEGIKPADVARSTGVPERTLRWRFMRSAGKTVAAYLDEQRVAKARVLLAARGARVGAVAREVGCGTANNLWRLFQRVTGKAPSAFR